MKGRTTGEFLRLDAELLVRITEAGTNTPLINVLICATNVAMFRGLIRLPSPARLGIARRKSRSVTFRRRIILSIPRPCRRLPFRIPILALFHMSDVVYRASYIRRAVYFYSLLFFPPVFNNVLAKMGKNSVRARAPTDIHLSPFTRDGNDDEFACISTAKNYSASPEERG